MEKYIDGKGVLVGKFTADDCRLGTDKAIVKAMRERILKEDGIKLYPEAQMRKGLLEVYLVKEEDLKPFWQEGDKTMAKQLMRNKQTGEVAEFKGCLFNNNDCIVLFNDNQTMRYKNLSEFQENWEKA